MDPNQIPKNPQEIPKQQIETSTTPLSLVEDVSSPQPILNAQVSSAEIASVRHKSKPWLWVIICALLVIIIGLVVGYIIVKGIADRTASTYTINIKAYVHDAYDAAIAPAQSPTDLALSIGIIKKPVLESVFLSGLSTSYGNAQTIDTTVVRTMSQVKTELMEYGNIYDIYHSIQDTPKAIVPDPNKDPEGYLKYYLDYVDTLVTVAASKTQIPNDLKTQVSDYLTAVIDLQTAQQSRYDALKAKNKINYLAANDDVSTKGKIFATSAMPIESYYQTLATRIKVSAKELQTYAETIQ